MAVKRRVVITGMGALSPLGDTPQGIHRALCEGRHGRRPVERFDTSETGVSEAGEIDFKARDYLAKGNLRPLDRTGQMVAVAAQRALDDSGWDEERRQEHPVGLALGTMYGSVHTIAAFDQRALEAGPQYVKPFDFANSVINAAAGQTAIWHHLWGLNSTLTGGTTAGAQAIAYAADLIRGGRTATVLAGGGEELCFESFFSAARAGLMAENGDDAVPFGAGRRGMSLAEGAALLMLEDADSASAKGGQVLGTVLGHASAFDPSRGKNDALAVEVLTRTLRQALDDAAVEAADISVISANAHGSPRLDRHEALALSTVFGRRMPPLCAVKGGLGESLGASAPLQVVVLLESWRQGAVPGVVGLGDLDEALPLGDLTAAPFELPEPGPALLVSAGFDGNVCALVLAPGS